VFGVGFALPRLCRRRRTPGRRIDRPSRSRDRGAAVLRLRFIDHLAYHRFPTQHGADFVPAQRRTYRTRSRLAQEAHEAIRPTDFRLAPSQLERVLDSDELKVYELIWKRTMASQMVDARVLRTTMEISAQGPDGEMAVMHASGKAIGWLILAAVLISSGNAVVRYIFIASSNAWLEAQWYLFAAVFLLASGYTLLRQEHVKIDVVLSHFSKRTQIIVESICIVVFLLPFCFVVVDLVLPLVKQAYETGETSSNAGGLIRWPVYALVPVGFSLLALQGVSELIKRVAFLMGLIEDPTEKKQEKTAEEELAEAILRAQKNQGAAQ